jgi:hypothetical protein
MIRYGSTSLNRSSGPEATTESFSALIMFAVPETSAAINWMPNEEELFRISADS